MSNVIGMTALLKTLGDLGKVSYSEHLVSGIRAGSEGLAGRVRSEAPRGPTGNLRDGVEWGVFKKRAGKPVAGFVRMSHKKAPHAHLVEFGARGGQMPANPFFRRATTSGADAALKPVEEGLGKAIDEAIK